LRVIRRYRLPDVCRKARMSPRHEPLGQLLGDGAFVDKPRQKALSEEPQQCFCVPCRQGMERPVFGERAVRHQEVSVWMPLEHVAGGRDGDHDPGPPVRSQLSPHVLGDGLRAALRQVEQELSPLAKDPTQEARHGEDDVTMREGLEHLFAQPLRPQERALLLARRGEIPSATRVRDQVARPTARTPSSGEAPCHVATLDEAAQHAFDDGAQGAVLLGEAFSVHTQEVLDVLADEAEEGRLLGLPGPVDSGADLHACPKAGGRVRRESRTSPRCAAGRAVCNEDASA
jgi:hypothetical protein